MRSLLPDKEKTLAARVPRRLYQRVRIVCFEEDRKIGAYITDALREHLVRVTKTK